ncbi:FG-GAP-like repeat-containing protein [Myxococcota bacterium]
MVAAALLSCGVELEVSDEAQISCRRNRHCITGYRCLNDRCVPIDGNLPPRITVFAIERALVQVTIPVEVADPDDATLTISAAYRVGGSGSFAPTDLNNQEVETRPEGASATLVWDARGVLEEAQHCGYLSQHCGYLSQVELKLTASDGESDVSVETPAFEFGNDPPDLTDVEISDGVVSGLTVISFFVADSAEDSVDVSLLEVARAPDFADAVDVVALDAPHGGSFPGGGTQSLPTSVAGKPHSITWDSHFGADYDTPEARLRMRVTDVLGGESQVVEAVVSGTETTVFATDNQSSPLILDAVARRSHLTHGSAPVAIHYRLADEESDPVDIRPEFSVDGGGTWLGCNEYKLPQSEGRYDLATAPLGVAGNGGIRHTFVWEPGGTMLAPGVARLRLSASDGKNNTITTVGIDLPLGVSPSSAAFLPETAYAAGPGARNTTAADFNGDHIIDLAVANATSGTVSILTGNGTGDGTFATATDFAAGAGPWSLAATDLNGDDLIDLIVVDRVSAAISILLGAGDGTFPSLLQYPAGDDPTALVIGDFDADAAVDVVVTDSGADSVLVLLGNGDGTFADAAAFVTGVDPASVVARDFDADSALDLAVVNAATDDVSILFGDGDGSFVPTSEYPVQQRPADLAAADFNLDGIADLAVTNSDSGSVSVLLGLGQVGVGDGTFAPALHVPVGPAPVGIIAAEINGDGFSDLVVCNRDTNAVSVMLGQNGGSLFARPSPLATGPDPLAVLACDLNSDTRVDLVASTEGSGGVGVLLGSSQQDVFFAPSQMVQGADWPTAVSAADLDADGITDLVAVDIDKIVLMRGSGQAGIGDGTFRDGVTQPASSPFGLATGDFNADQVIDIAVASTVDGRVSVYFGNGNPFAPDGFSSPSHLPAGIQPIAVVSRDLDWNSIPDLIVASDGSSDVHVFLSNGDATFESVGPFPTPGAVASMVTGDFDADSILDVAVTSWRTQGVTVLLGVGAGVFGAGRYHQFYGSVPRGLISADFNSDGATDIATANWGSHDVSILMGVIAAVGPSLVFTQTVPVGMRPDMVGTGDIDGDGILDLIVSSEQSNAFGLLRGLGDAGVGDGTFADPISLGRDVTPFGVLLDDFNDDGIMDLATPTLDSGNISVRLGQQDGFRHAFVRPLVPWEDSGSASAGVWGPDVTRQGLDRFGSTYVNDTLVQSPVRYPVVPPVPGLQAITRPWRILGDVRLTRVTAEIPEGERLRLEHRFGPRRSPSSATDFSRTGLDLDSAPHRGIVLTLPFLDARSITDATSARVFVRTSDWLRADELAADRFFGDYTAHAYLPQLVESTGEESHEVLWQQLAWTEIPLDADDDLATGSGARFVVHSDPPRIQVLTDVLGTFQVVQNLCGNDHLDGGEFCDDGNRESGDGCDDSCRIECGGSCDLDADQPTCASSDSACVCQGPEWTGYICSELCAAYGVLSAGCAYDPGADMDSCWCNQPFCIDTTIIHSACAALTYGLCTCASTDPCGWAGDGICDQHCVDDFIDHFDDSDDCINCSNAPAVQSQCDSMQYTVCTCASTDPCGWVEDGSCDQFCIDTYSDHFDDTVDCTFDCSDTAAVQADCDNLDYTPCTCASADPCVWAGDGYCDQFCVDNYVDHFDDAADCTFSCSDTVAVQNDCNDLEYTPCTCASADPCAWAGDDYCDQFCIDTYVDHFDDSADCL